MGTELYCKHESCQDDWDKEQPDCQCGHADHNKCPNYVVCVEKSITKTDQLTGKEGVWKIPWHSNAMGHLDIDWIIAKKQPTIIGIIGETKAGKTTLLATLYMLLRNGKSIGDYSFAGSYTLLGWDKLAHFFSLHRHKQVSFPPHTSSNSVRVPGLLHLLLKNGKGRYRHLLFTDAPGEWFKDWAVNATLEISKGARWIDNNADGFIVVADTIAFQKAVGKARRRLMSIVERMRNTHKGRPATLIWAKSDVNLDKEIKSIISNKVRKNLPNSIEFDVAVINRKSDALLNNLLKAIDHIMVEINSHHNTLQKIKTREIDDFFFLIRPKGHE